MLYVRFMLQKSRNVQIQVSGRSMTDKEMSGRPFYVEAQLRTRLAETALAVASRPDNNPKEKNRLSNLDL